MIDEWFETVGNRPFRIINWLFTKQRQYFSPLWSWWASTHSKRRYREVEFTQLGPNIITHEDQLVAMAALKCKWLLRNFPVKVSAKEITVVNVRIDVGDQQSVTNIQNLSPAIVSPTSVSNMNTRCNNCPNRVPEDLRRKWPWINDHITDHSNSRLSILWFESSIFECSRKESKHQSWSWLVWWCQKTFT